MTSPSGLSAEDRARLRLIRSDQIGPITLSRLIARYGSAEAAIEHLPELVARAEGRELRLCDEARIGREMGEVERLGARYLFLGDPDYPSLLAEAEGAPPVLIVQGRVSLLERPLIAMVGARNASAAGCRFARRFAHELGEAGLTIVSGLARGIDRFAHEGTMETGTVAVVAGGIDIVYPPEHRTLQEAIGEKGLLVSEQPPGTIPRARHFPSRNRIIAGLSTGTIVVEAAPRSGSLITARLAAEFGREVMAVPGSPLDPRAQGCNLLIREGATLVQNVDDVLEATTPFGLILRPPAPARPSPIDPPRDVEGDRDRVDGLLGATPIAVDELIRQSGQPAASVHAVLLELELAGRLERHAGGRVSRV